MHPGMPVEGWKVPARQARHSVDRFVLVYEPAAQLKQIWAPVPDVYRPVVQASQPDMPMAG